MAKPGVDADDTRRHEGRADAGAVDAERRVRHTLIGAGAASSLLWIVVLAVWQDGVFAFTFDDAYYYFGIARNIADGHGSTFDQINATNGYHPLWMAICVVPYKLGLDDMAAARSLLIFQLVAGWAATLAIIATIVSRAVAGWASFGAPRVADITKADITKADDAAGGGSTPALRRWATATLTIVFVLIVANPFVVKAFVNGLESGIAVTLYALLLLVAVDVKRWIDQPLRWRFGVAVLLTLIFLARTDAAFLLACLGIWCLGETFARPAKGAPIRRRIASLASLFALPAVTAAVYLVLNQAAFGTPVQVSGLVKRAPFDASTLGPFAAFVVVAGLLQRHAFRRAHGRRAARRSRFPRAAAFAVRTGWFGAFGIVIVGYYNLLQTQQWLWYYCPVLLYLIVLLMLALTDIIDVAVAGATTTRRTASAPTRSPVRLLAPVLAIFVVPLAIGYVIEVRGFVDPTLLSIQQANRDAGLRMRERLPDDAVAASWDAGVVGYFAQRRVVNIDGVVNSVEYYRTMADGTYLAFLRCERVGYIVNHGVDVDGRDPDIDALLRQIYGAEMSQRATVIERVPFTYSGTTNTGGFELAGTHDLVVHVYEVPADARGPRPDDRCP